MLVGLELESLSSRPDPVLSLDIFLHFSLSHTMASHTGVVPFLISLLSYIVLGPFFILSLLTNEIARLLVTLYLQLKYNGEIWLVPDGNDGVWATKRPENTRMVLSVARCKGNINRDVTINVYKNQIRQELDSKGNFAYGKLECILIEKCGYACWKQDKLFDIENHIRYLDEGVYHKEDMKELMKELSEDMEPCRPQWEFVLVPHYQEEGEEETTGWVILRFHHGFGDGLSLILLMERYLTTNFTYYLDPIKFQVPSWKRYLYYLSSVLHGPYAMFSMIKSQSNTYWPTLPSSEESTMERNYTWISDVEIDKVRTIRKVTDKTTIQSIVQNAFISAASQVLPSKRIPDEWVIAELAALLPYDEYRPQNRFTAFLYNINSSGEDFTRLRESKKAAWEGVTGPFIPMIYFLVSILGRMPVSLHYLLMLRGAISTLGFSNVPLSKTRLFGLGNEEILELFALLPQPNDTGITLFSCSYLTNMKIAAVVRSDWIRREELEDIMGRIPGIIEDWAKKADKMVLNNNAS